MLNNCTGCRTCTCSTICSTKGQRGCWPLLTTSRNKYKPAERGSNPMKQQCWPKYIESTENYIQENSNFNILVYMGRLKAKGARKLAKYSFGQHREWWHWHDFVSVAPSCTGSRGAKRRLSRLGAAVARSSGVERGQARPLWPRARPGSPSQPASRAAAGMRYSYMPPM